MAPQSRVPILFVSLSLLSACSALTGGEDGEKAETKDGEAEEEGEAEGKGEAEGDKAEAGGEEGENAELPPEPTGIAIPAAPATVSSTISSGMEHGCLLKEGQVMCWGGNGAGELGDGTRKLQHNPVKVRNLRDIVEVEVGYGHTCALNKEGKVSCWGQDNRGQLGNGPGGPSATPVEVLDNVSALSLRSQDSCAVLKDGTASCWGASAASLDGSGGDVLVPTKIEGVTDLVDIAVGTLHACGLKKDGDVVCWGRDDSGQLGGGKGPATVSAAGKAVALAAGNLHTCALRADGTVFCWGGADKGQLGTADGKTSGGVVQDLTGAVAITAGHKFTCALKQDGTVWCWGDAEVGQLGSSAGEFSAKPVAVPGVSEATEIAAGLDHACAKTKDSVTCWGENGSGQLGGGETATKPLGFFELPGINDAELVAVGFRHVCTLRKADGKVHCSGEAPWGEGELDVLDFALAKEVVGGKFHVCLGSKGEGKIRCFSSKEGRWEPASELVDLNAEGDDTCGVTRSGDVLCWGAGEEAKPLDGYAGTGRLHAIAKSFSHECVLDDAEQVLCNGQNEFGQLGDGQRHNTGRGPAPVKPVGLAKIAQIDTGDGYTCARAENGTVKCWEGQAAGKVVPTVIADLIDAKSVSASGSYGCAVKRDGKVACWGSNTFGQLGNGSKADSPGATEVLGISDAVQVATTLSIACARLRSGRVQCWGSTEKIGGPAVGEGALPSSTWPLPS